MASKLLLIVLLVLVSVTCAYSLSTRDAVLKQDDESYFMARSDQGSSTMIDVEDVARPRRLQALVAGSKVVVNKAVSKITSISTSNKIVRSSNKVGALEGLNLAGIIIAVVVVAIVILCVIYYNFYQRRKEEKAQSVGQEQINGSSETQTSTLIENRV